MERSKILLVIMIPVLSFMACKSNAKKEKSAFSDIKTFIEDHPGLQKGNNTYTISTPDGWKRKDTMISGVQIARIESPLDGPGDTFRENITIVTEDASHMDLKEYIAANRKSMETQMPAVKFLTEENITIGVEPAIAMNISLPYSGYDIRNTEYFLVKNNIGYVITCTATSTTFNTYQPTFIKCVNTFSIKTD